MLAIVANPSFFFPRKKQLARLLITDETQIPTTFLLLPRTNRLKWSCIFPVYWPLKVLKNTCHIHTHRWWPCKAPIAHQEQFGVQYLAQGHVSTQLPGARIWTSNLPITRQPALPTEPQPLSYTEINKTIIWQTFLKWSVPDHNNTFRKQVFILNFHTSSVR